MSVADPGKAYELLGSAARELFGHMDRDEAILRLAGSTPQAGRNRRAQGPWPVLAAYVLAHDEQGQALATRSGDVLNALSDAAVDGDLGEDDMLAGTRTVQEAHKVLLHDRYLAVANKLVRPQAPPRAPILNPARR